MGELHPEQAAAILDRVRDVDANRLSLADARHQIADKLRDLGVDPSRDNDEGGEVHDHGGGCTPRPATPSISGRLRAPRSPGPLRQKSLFTPP